MIYLLRNLGLALIQLARFMRVAGLLFVVVKRGRVFATATA
jgi:hypothetical protein